MDFVSFMVFLPILWLGGGGVTSILCRRRAGKPMFPRAPADAVGSASRKRPGICPPTRQGMAGSEVYLSFPPMMAVRI
jgi:hypothetical protein